MHPWSRNCRNLILSITAILLPLPHAAGQTLSLAEAVSRALERNPELAAVQPEGEAARLDFRAAAAGYLPRLDFEQSYLAGNNPVFVFSTLLTQNRFTSDHFALPALNSPSAEDNLQTRVTVQQMIWDFGRTGSRRDQAEAGVKIADLSYEATRLRVLLDVFKSYYGVSLARASLETARLALRSAEAIEGRAQAHVDSGTAVEADLLRSRVYLAAARQQEIEAQGRLKSAEAQLNRLMANELGNPVGETIPLMPRSIPLPPEEILVEEQKRHRPDYASLLTAVQAAETEVRARRKEFLPLISGYGTWEMDNPSLSDYGADNWAAGVTLQWNLFAGGADAARRDAAGKRLLQRKLQAKAMESGMALEIHNALIQCRSAEQQVAAAEAAEAQSEEGVRILKNRYEAGLATMTDLLSVETERSAARTALAEAIYRQRVSYAQMEYAAGILSPASESMNLK